MRRKENCRDNAIAESYFKIIKYEWLNTFKYISSEQISDSIAEYIKWFNTKRIHSSLGYSTPLEIKAYK
ncbi:integrase core domain-containing protein [Sphingobacterium rhinopitheci]|uniref:integrase core domain-containing protein n=1 Tax=Sphingobacterium rhinopitheci TaxID=2781960 RepID=UPI00374DADD9|nr:transposase [Sphingobacterium rhinopitheci]